MPQIATSNEGSVLPHQASKGDELECPICGDSMTVVKSHSRKNSFVVRHFRHDTTEDCPGESKEHLRMKSIAYQKLSHTYPDSEIYLEEKIGDRRADVLVRFPTPKEKLGKGIAVEVQYKNDSKDITKTDQDYYTRGYSVLWLSQQHYSEKDVSVDHIQPVWRLMHSQNSVAMTAYQLP